MRVVRNGADLRLLADAVDFRDDAVEILRPVADQGAEMPDACLRRIVRWHIGVRTTLQALGAPPLGSLPESLAAYAAEAAAKIAALEGRRDALLATVARVSQQTPFPEELEGWTDQRAKMLAEIGTLRARVQELETAVADREAAMCRLENDYQENAGAWSAEVDLDEKTAAWSAEVDKCTEAIRQRDAARTAHASATDHLITARAALATEQHAHRATIEQRDDRDCAAGVLLRERDAARVELANTLEDQRRTMEVASSQIAKLTAALDAAVEKRAEHAGVVRQLRSNCAALADDAETHEDAINAVRIELQTMTDALRIERAERAKDRAAVGAVLDREHDAVLTLTRAVAEIQHNADRHVAANVGALARVIYDCGLRAAYGATTAELLARCGAGRVVSEAQADGFVASLSESVDAYARELAIDEAISLRDAHVACIASDLASARAEIERLRAAGVSDEVFDLLSRCRVDIGAALDDYDALDARAAGAFAHLYDALTKLHEPMQRARIAAEMPACPAGKRGCILKNAHTHGDRLAEPGGAE